MGVRNYLIDGVSGAGKTTVAEALERRGYDVVHGDRALAYLGDPETGDRLDDDLDRLRAADNVTWAHEHWIWDVAKVRSRLADQHAPETFFCGGSRNHRHFAHLFDQVFVLDLDLDTLNRRLARRGEDEFGGRPRERALIVRKHATNEDTPQGAVSIDATAPLDRVVDAILAQCGAQATREAE
jgi:broad-specificity NMP kinase